MKKLINNYLPGLATALTLMVIAAVGAYAANTVPKAPSKSSIADGQNCSLSVAVLSGVTMESSRSFGINQDNNKPTRPLVDLIIKLTDANTSITRFDVTCTVSHDANTTDITPQTVTVESGVATQNDALIFQKASPGTKNWLVSFHLGAMPDFECTLAVGTGSGAAADVVTVDVRMCAP
jgi:hypothetical protein